MRLANDVHVAKLTAALRGHKLLNGVHLDGFHERHVDHDRVRLEAVFSVAAAGDHDLGSKLGNDLDGSAHISGGCGLDKGSRCAGDIVVPRRDVRFVVVTVLGADHGGIASEVGELLAHGRGVDEGNSRRSRRG